MPGGAHHDLVLEISDQPLAGPPADPGRAWAATSDAWSRTVPAITGTIADRDAGHAYAVLQGLTSSGGGMVAGRGACHHPDGVVRFVSSSLATFAAEISRHRTHGPCGVTRRLLPTPATGGWQ